MKTHSIVTVLAACLLGVISCNKSGNRSMQISPETILASWDGGTYCVGLDIVPDYAINDITTTSEDWIIRNWISEDESKLYFEVSLNETGASREGDICISSEAADLRGEIKIIQTFPRFSINTSAEGNVAEITVVPEDESVLYYIGVTDNISNNHDSIADLVKDEFTGKLEELTASGISLQESLGKLCNTGQTTGSFELDPLKEYIAAVLAVDRNGNCALSEGWKTFSTGEQSHPISISYSDIRPVSIKVSVKAEDDYSYVLLFERNAFWSEMTDDEVIEYLNKGDIDLKYFKHTGSSDYDVNRLLPDTEYVTIAFGYSDGEITSPLLRKFIRTAANKENSASVECTYDKYFNGTELEELYPYDFFFASGHIVLPVKFTPAGGAIEYYYGLWDKQTIDGFTDDEVVDKLLYDGESYDTNAFYLPFSDGEYVIAAIAVDSGGNLGRLKKDCLSILKDNISPADEYERQAD